MKWKKAGTYTLEEIAILNQQRMKIKKRAETSDGIPKLHTARAAHTSKAGMVEPFRRLQPEVKARAQEWLVSLLNKHKAKMESKSPVDKVRYKASLIAVATHMAMRDFGLIISCRDARRKGAFKTKELMRVEVFMGIRDASTATRLQE